MMCCNALIIFSD